MNNNIDLQDLKRRFPDAIILFEQNAYEGQHEGYRAKFHEAKERLGYASDSSKFFDIKAGDLIHFKNGYDVEMITEVLGFDEENKAFLLWDCYWFTIHLGERLLTKTKL